jgi:hypothetical protein
MPPANKAVPRGATIHSPRFFSPTKAAAFYKKWHRTSPFLSENFMTLTERQLTVARGQIVMTPKRVAQNVPQQQEGTFRRCRKEQEQAGPVCSPHCSLAD